MRSFIKPSLVAIVVCASAACGSTEAPEKASSKAASATTSSDASALVGRYVFVLEESKTVWAGLQASCAKKADPKGCVKEIADEARLEGVRLSVDPNGHLVWTSYVLSADGTKEDIDLEATLDARWDAKEISGTVIGAPRGMAAPKKSLPEMKMVRLDANTIAMDDHDKGRLIFRRQ